MTPDDLHGRALDDVASTALLFDFDGTLSSIVEDPAAAEPFDGVLHLLDRLAERVRRVAVVSGRPRSFLVARFDAAIDLSGLYGLETRIDGVETDHPEAGPWRSVIATVTESARTLPDSVTVESKGLSLTVHFRREPADEPAVRAWATAAVERSGLDLREAKASVELHPPLAVDKGTSVRSLVQGCKTIIYVGDDLGDLPAFRALDELRADGLNTCKVATGGPELPAEVAREADLVVPGPAGVVDLFAPLVDS